MIGLFNLNLEMEMGYANNHNWSRRRSIKVKSTRLTYRDRSEMDVGEDGDECLNTCVIMNPICPLFFFGVCFTVCV